MIHRRRSVPWLRLTTLALLLSGECGCSRMLGPERFVVARVKGVVKEGARPVSGGWIEFFPLNGTVGNLCSARLNADGSFEAAHVAVGENLVRLANASLSSEAAKRLFGAYTSPIRRTIPAQPSGPVVIDVVDEAIRWRNSRPPATRPDPGQSGATR